MTCEDTETSCTSCDQTGAFPFFFHNDCTDVCPVGISVEVDNSCVECDSTCSTCETTPNTCTTCESHMKFDPEISTCEHLCLPETQIFVPDEGECQNCNYSCTKCSGNINTCTACKPEYLLNLDMSCQETCNSDNQTPIEGICNVCEEPCASCDGSTSTCLSCIDDYYLISGTICVQYCPLKYIVDETETRCIYEGLVCPDGFEINSSADGCIPLTYDCDAGYIINDTRTACVPKPGSPVPFPFILIAIFICFLVLGSYLKDK